MINSFKYLATLSITSIATIPFSQEIKSEDYEKGFYGFGGISYNKFTDWTGIADATNVEMKHSAAAGSTIGIGYDFGNTWKTDFSWYRTFAYFDKATVGSVSADLLGRFQLNSFIFGISKDLKSKGTFPKITPYMGVGLGLGKLYSKEGVTVNVSNVSATSGEMDGDYGFLYSLKGGLDYAISKNKDIYGELKWVGFNGDVDGEVAVDSGGIIGIEIGYKWKF